MAEARKGGKKGRKIGGNLRSPAMIAYRMEMRWAKNKKIKIERNQKREVVARAEHRRNGSTGCRAKQIARNAAHKAA